MPLSRRRALQLAIVGSIPTTGCLGRSNGTTPTTDTTDRTDPRTSSTPESDTETTEPETATGVDTDTSTETVLELGESFESSDGTAVRVDSVELRRLVRSTSVGSSSHIDVAWLDGYQFAVTDLAVSGPADNLGSEIPLALEVDGTQYPLPEQHWYRTFPPGTGMGSEERRPAYPAPITAAQSVSIIWLREQPVRWQLPTETVAQLNHAPVFEIKSLTVPDSVTRGLSFDASVTVRNTGANGRFVTEFGAGPISDHGEVNFPVPSDSERTFTTTVDPYYSENTSSVDVYLDWGKERLTRTVTVE